LQAATAESVNFTIERPQKTSTLVAERLQALILSKELRPGTKLPTERALCQRLGVSRTVLREAIKLLSARGLIEEVVGRGTFVSKPNFESVRNALKLCLDWHADVGRKNLIELRALVEVEAAGLAAVRATKEQIAELRKNLTEMESLADASVERFVEVDFEFHKGLARAAHNELLVMLLEVIAGALVASWEAIESSPEVRTHAIVFHEKILTAVEQRNARQARRAMAENLQAYTHDLEDHLD
jgi:GntR family transcriptional repressor for pyruvate dehydrogenase complex